MMKVALLFLILAVIVALLGFGWVSNLSFWASRTAFGVLLVLALLFFIVALARSAPPPGDVA
jgi:uncharacterized membrane protein YtjA (UPF0391 family)